MKVNIKIDAVTFLVLFLIFVILKIMGLITWSWFWVLSPLWIIAGLISVLVIGFFLFTIINIIIGFLRLHKSKRRK